MYPLLVFLHVVGVFGFLMAHGASASVAFALRRERDPERVRALLMLSATSYPVMYSSLWLLFILGIVLGFMGSWWGRAWIWTSLILLIAIVVIMSRLGANIYGEARKLSGLSYMVRGKIQPPSQPASAAEIEAALAQGNPILLTAIGFGGIVIIAALMMFKPF
ncbi:MAG TPA: hypothetical protein VFF59_06510 [Anaerolineae bacterium]|nr:hypothetical protein [Anaerolineae bacterium]